MKMLNVGHKTVVNADEFLKKDPAEDPVHRSIFLLASERSDNRRCKEGRVSGVIELGLNTGIKGDGYELPRNPWTPEGPKCVY
jgi:hypothetical protein